MKKGLVYTLFSVTTVVLLVFSVYLYTVYKEALVDKQYYSDKNISLSEQIRELKSTVAELEKRNEIQAQRISDLTNKSVNSMYSGVILEEDKSLCIIPNCGSVVQDNSFYCFRHECSKAGCHEKRANDFCSYCINHKCTVPNCNQGQAYNSIYCYLHKAN